MNPYTDENGHLNGKLIRQRLHEETGDLIGAPSSELWAIDLYETIMLLYILVARLQKRVEELEKRGQ